MQKDGTPFASSSGALHRSKGTAPARPQKPPKRPARAEHHRALLRRLWPFLARLERIAAAGPDPSARRANPAPGYSATRTAGPRPRPSPGSRARPSARGRNLHQRGRPRGYIAPIWLHGGYMAPESKKANPGGLA